MRRVSENDGVRERASHQRQESHGLPSLPRRSVIAKFKDGETVQDYRYRRKQERKNGELAVKRELRTRDGIGCRWPGCDLWKQGHRVEAAHLNAKGMGGDKRLLRTTLDQLIRVCHAHHQGIVSLHSGDLKIVPHTSQGTNGPCDF